MNDRKPLGLISSNILNKGNAEPDDHSCKKSLNLTKENIQLESCLKEKEDLIQSLQQRVVKQENKIIHQQQQLKKQQNQTKPYSAKFDNCKENKQGNYKTDVKLLKQGVEELSSKNKDSTQMIDKKLENISLLQKDLQIRQLEAQIVAKGREIKQLNLWAGYLNSLTSREAMFRTLLAQQKQLMSQAKSFSKHKGKVNKAKCGLKAIQFTCRLKIFAQKWDEASNLKDK